MHDGAGVAHYWVERGGAFDRMSGGRKLGEEFVGKSAFQAQRRARFSPGSAEHPTRGGDRLLEVLAVKGISREQRGLGLRLSISAHGAVHHRAAIGKARECRI